MAQYNLIQWNCRGLRGSREEIEIIINKYSPAVFCIQETKLKNGQEQTFKNHHAYYNCTESGGGGVAILVKDNVPHSQISLSTKIQAVAVRIDIDGKAYSVCSIYIPPDNTVNISIKDLKDLKSQIKSPVIFMGDFNSHSLMWGFSEPDSRGKILEKFIIDEDLILFNNKHHTYFSSGYSSLLDLTLCQPSVFMDFTCKIFEDTNGSDHCPIQLIYNNFNASCNDQTPRWNLKKADWFLFRQLCIEKITPDKFIESDDSMVMNNNDKMSAFTDLLLYNAIEAIPMTKPNPKKKPKPYFDKECKDNVNERKKAFIKSKNSTNLQTIRHYQLIRARCRRTIKRKKRSSFRQYVSSINERTPAKKVWEKINKITGKNNNKLLHHLKDENNQLITDKKGIANKLGESFQQCSSSDNYSPDFQKIKHDAEKEDIDFNTQESRNYNKKFKMRDLKWSIKKSKSSAPGIDHIHYDM